MIRTGLFKIHISLSEWQGEAAVPEDLVAGVAFKNLHNQRHNLGWSAISQDPKRYSSNAFLVEALNDEIRIGDACLFSISINAAEDLRCAPLVLSVRLMFCSSFSRVYRGEPTIPPDESFTEESLVRVTIKNPLIGVHEFCQMSFDDLSFSTLDLIVHTQVQRWESLPTMCKLLFPQVSSLQQTELEQVYDHILHPQVAHLHRLSCIAATFETQVQGFHQIVERVVDPRNADLQALLQQYWQMLTQCCCGGNTEVAAACVARMLNELAMHCQELFNALWKLSGAAPEALLRLFQTLYRQSQSQIYENAIFREVHTVDCIPLEANEELSKTHKLMAQARRSQQRLPTETNELEIAEEQEYNINTLPILFEDSYITQSRAPTRSVKKGFHLVVLVHGYDGSPIDVLFLRNELAKRYYSNTFYLCSRTNDGATKGDIFDMGRRLAREIRTFADEQHPNVLGKVSIIGYSLGGVVARAALEDLQDWADKMHAFISLSSPHLGLMYMTSSIVDAGLWIVKSWTQSTCLKQLAMSDNSEIPQTTLYRLSKHPGLTWFEHVLLFSSTQDNYSPIESSRLELSRQAQNGSDKGCFFVEMAWNLISGLKPERVRRVDVDFALPSMSLDSLIGRKAHTEFIENRQFFAIFAEKYREVFI